MTIRTKPWPKKNSIDKEEKEAVIKIFDKAIKNDLPITYNGEEEKAYCKEFSEYMGSGYTDAVNSGTSALYVALKALNIEPFSEVIIGAITDPGGMMPIPLLNCIPIIADTEPNSYNTGPNQIEPLITSRTNAIVIPHIAGEPADIINIIKLAKKYNIPVIEDCAQSHGAEINGEKVGTFGDISILSTMFEKHHCTGGQGGLIFTKNESIYQSILRNSDRGKPFFLENHTNITASLNFNSNEISCAIGRIQLKKLNSIVEKRRDFVNKLKKELNSIPSIEIPKLVTNAKPSYLWFRITINTNNIEGTKQEYYKALINEGLKLMPDYNRMPHTFDWYKNKSVFGTSQLPWSSSEYQGNPNQKFPCINAHKTIQESINIIINENYRDAELIDIVNAFKKVNKMFTKN